MRNLLPYHPLVFFWIAEYEDGKALPQFDPETGEENKFTLTDKGKLKKFGWHPFTPELSHKIIERSGLITIPTNNPHYVISLEKGDKLIAKRENIIKFRMKSGVINRETIYVLGKITKHGEKIVYRIKEDGTAEQK